MADQQPAREDLCTRFLREIADVPTTSFFEHRVNNRIRRILTEQFGQNEVVETSADGFGNVIVHYKGSKNVDHPLNIAYVVHTDHPGFHATPLASKQLMLKLMGGLNKGLVVGSLVDLYDCYDHELPCITRGIISEEFDAESANPSGRYRMATDDHVDQRAFAVLHLPELEISDSIIRAPVLDDYASIAMSLAALKDVVDKKLSVDVYVVFHRGEEIGFVGAYGVASSELLPRDTLVYSVETSSYKGKRDPNDTEMKDIVRVGKGAVVRTGDKISAQYNMDAIALSHAAAIGMGSDEVQEARMYAGTCEASLYYALGYRASGICLPLVGWHNNGSLEGENKMIQEGVHPSDLRSGTKLLTTMAHELAENPHLYTRIGINDITPQHEALVRSVANGVRHYREQSLI